MLKSDSDMGYEILYEECSPSTGDPFAKKSTRFRFSGLVLPFTNHFFGQRDTLPVPMCVDQAHCGSCEDPVTWIDLEHVAVRWCCTLMMDVRENVLDILAGVYQPQTQPFVEVYVYDVYMLRGSPLERPVSAFFKIKLQTWMRFRPGWSSWGSILLDGTLRSDRWCGHL